jgi:uncharacterized protein (DUF2267 family)
MAHTKIAVYTAFRAFTTEVDEQSAAELRTQLRDALALRPAERIGMVTFRSGEVVMRVARSEILAWADCPAAMGQHLP